MTKVGILGCMGRMGQALTFAVQACQDLQLVVGSERSGHDAIGGVIPGTDATIVGSAEEVFAVADMVIDFTPPGSTAAHALLAANTRTKLIVGTTGLSTDDMAALDAAASSTAVMQAGNYSLGVNMLMALTQQAAAKLGVDWDIEIVEMHHRHKVDAPSGTALMLGEAAAEGRGVVLDDVRTPAREGITGERREGTIGFTALRGGSVIGEHSVVLASESERITLSHRAENRTLFADGAVRAAVWLKSKDTGRYSMQDVLGL
ncbi:4-hydroxy-tetrahydrodipicolinate reductase [Kordiimonas aquimaris]|uniref:4-hydroxy-tetrahydrodipicolinate reductase n=1 Tax=Kordiimonas aquimaris TaxID=707591 RepID=UPI0021D1C6C2|nr:4-hydroxy-tetrahydrodipicolinate reductase [Kordiimonas aquimaris]